MPTSPDYSTSPLPIPGGSRPSAAAANSICSPTPKGPQCLTDRTTNRNDRRDIDTVQAAATATAAVRQKIDLARFYLADFKANTNALGVRMEPRTLRENLIVAREQLNNAIALIDAACGRQPGTIIKHDRRPETAKPPDTHSLQRRQAHAHATHQPRGMDQNRRCVAPSRQPRCHRTADRPAA